MRIMGFSVMWDKLNREEFTTVRFPRKDTDWYEGERVQVVYRPRSKGRKPLFIADIIKVESRTFDPTSDIAITDEEAIADGFPGALTEMMAWFFKHHSKFDRSKVFNKITLRRYEFK